MSAPPVIELRSHVYGSTPRGFATLFSDEAFDRGLVSELERRSSYSVPATVARQDPSLAPTKYLYGTFGDTAFVGRAKYLGVDLTGRLGNYVLHCLVFELSEASALFESPLGMLARCEAQEVFLDSVPADGLGLPPTQLQLLETYRVRPVALSGDVLIDLVSAAMNGPTTDPPILLQGGEDAVLDALEDVYSCLPFAMRWRCTFDTYALGAFPQGLVFAALPSDPVYVPPPPHIARVDLASSTIAWIAPRPRNPLAEFICRTTSVSEERAILLSAIDLLAVGQWTELADTLAAASPDVLASFYANYKRALLERIAHDGDERLALVLDAAVGAADVQLLGPDDRMGFVRVAGSRTRASLAKLIASQSGEVVLSGLAFADESFLSACLDVALATRRQLPLVMTLLRLLGGVYTTWAEERLMPVLIEQSRLALSTDDSETLLAALAVLPAPDSALAAQRAVAEWALGDTTALARYVLAARTQADQWTSRPDTLRFVVQNLGRVPIEEAADIVVEMLAQNPRGSRGRTAFDRSLAALLSQPDGMGSDRKAMKALTKRLDRMDVSWSELPASERVVSGPEPPERPARSGRWGSDK